jgi:hypothetical protein
LVSVRVRVGTNAALIAPSAKSSRSRPGIRVAIHKCIRLQAGAEGRRLRLVAHETEDAAAQRGQTNQASRFG